MAERAANDAPRSVLVVDDEADILASLKLFLEKSIRGLRVHVASSGPAALELLQHEKVNLILTDYKMPGMNGLQFLKEVHKVAPGVPSIMITAFPDPQLAAKAVNEFGVGLFIAKPFDLGYLVDVVSSLLQ